MAKKSLFYKKPSNKRYKLEVRDFLVIAMIVLLLLGVVGVVLNEIVSAYQWGRLWPTLGTIGLVGGGIGLVINTFMPRQRDGEDLRSFRKFAVVVLILGLFPAMILGGFSAQGFMLAFMLSICCMPIVLIVGICQLVSARRNPPVPAGKKKSVLQRIIDGFF